MQDQELSRHAGCVGFFMGKSLSLLSLRYNGYRFKELNIIENKVGFVQSLFVSFIAIGMNMTE